MKTINDYEKMYELVTREYKENLANARSAGLVTYEEYERALNKLSIRVHAETVKRLNESKTD